MELVAADLEVTSFSLFRLGVEQSVGVLGAGGTCFERFGLMHLRFLPLHTGTIINTYKCKHKASRAVIKQDSTQKY